MKPTLLVLAAGMGSRYGGLKQLDPVGPSGEVVLDYSVHDALWAGFGRVVFVIRRDFEEEFRRVVVARYASDVEVVVAYQELDDLPDGFQVPAGREKPWGTGQAIWAARHAIGGPFLVVNADDFYGMEAFSIMGSFLGKDSLPGLRMALVAYPLRNTLSEHGVVSRGICSIGPNQELLSVEECIGITRTGQSTIVGVDTGGTLLEFAGSEMVSMNFWGFTREIFPHLENHFRTFLDSGGLENPKSEFYIPSAVTSVIASGAAPASVLISAGRWFGVTYREDRQAVADSIAQMVKDRLYPTPLWSHLK